MADETETRRAGIFSRGGRSGGEPDAGGGQGPDAGNGLAGGQEAAAGGGNGTKGAVGRKAPAVPPDRELTRAEQSIERLLEEVRVTLDELGNDAAGFALDRDGVPNRRPIQQRIEGLLTKFDRLKDAKERALAAEKAAKRQKGARAGEELAAAGVDVDALLALVRSGETDRSKLARALAGEGGEGEDATAAE